MYITKLANVFFSSVIETGKEFRKIFNKSSNASGEFCFYVEWAITLKEAASLLQSFLPCSFVGLTSFPCDMEH